MADIEEVIEESLEDSTPDPEPTELIAEEATETPVDEPEETPEPASATPAVEAPVAAPKAPKQDEFEKKYGVAAQSVTGRENRIPYSRVKKITEKAISDAKKELEGTYSPKIKEYEGRLTKVAEFENVMLNKPDQFLQMLASIPVYQEFFQAVEKAFAAGQTPQQPHEAQTPPDPNAGRPEPDQALSDGTRVYSMKGLDALNAWNRAQARKETLEEVNKIYGPIQKDWEVQQRYAQAMPVVQAQIAEAQTWHLFKENEDEIVKVLQQNPKITLEGAYNKVVFPKLKTDRQKMREEILKELKQAPKSTSVPVTGGKAAPVPGAKRSIEEIIAEQVETLKK